MSGHRVWSILRKDIAVGPRSPVILFVLIMPVVFTLVLQLAFGTFAARNARLALVDEGDSSIPALIAELPGIDVTVLSDADELRRTVEANDFDGGLILQPGFDQAVRAGQRPLLQLYMGGESYAVNRIVLAVTTVDVVREVEGTAPPVNVEMVDLGSADPVPMSTRFIPFIVLFAFMISGIFVPASSLVEERERKTIVAVLATPARLGEFIAAKGILGVGLTLAMTIATLALNAALGPSYAAMLVVLVVTSIFWTLIGLVVGLLARNSEMLFAVVKGSGVLLMGPVVFYIFPDWPSWIARLFPTFWAVDPLWQIMAHGARLADVALSLAVVVAMCVAFIPVVVLLGRRMQTQLASS